ncbi:MAG TPA: thioesterase family protein [Nevskiaceae bacterium]|nr:thioesterase family protein [Nevskiaceae bacterium]
MDFSGLLAAMRSTDGIWTATVDADWLQGRSVFGGLQAAIAWKAMRALVAPEVPLRTLQVTFAAPIPAGDVVARAKVLRQGKSATQVEARLGAGDESQCVVLGVFGVSRESSVRILPTAPAAPGGKAIDFTFVPGVTPNFTQFLPMRWLSGTPPYTNNPATRHVIEVNMKDRGPFSEAHLLAIADAPPPVALSMLRKPAAGSSMTWTMEFLAQDLQRQPLTGWRLDVEVVAARDGYTSQSVMVWTPGGELGAISRQSMVVFA